MSADFFLAPSAVVLRNNINERYPKRDHGSDGWVGDTSHQARKSEHNPCWICSGRNRGIVLATDTDIDDNDPKHDLRTDLIEELTGDPRIWYWISNGIICSRTHNWERRRYTGSNGHFHHFHTSFLIERAWDTSPFFGPRKPVRTQPLFLDISRVREEMLHVVVGKQKPREDVMIRRMQRLYNARLGMNLRLDGIAGPATLNANVVLERRFGGAGRPRVPDEITLRRANKGMFRLVA